MSFLSLYHDKGLKGEVVCGKGEIVPRPFCKRSRCGTTFQCINGRNGERLLLAACVGLSFPDIAAIEQ